jgi:hypothetical protein
MRIFLFLTGTIYYFFTHGLPFELFTGKNLKPVTYISTAPTEIQRNDTWKHNNDLQEYEEEGEEEMWEEVASNEQEDLIENQAFEQEGEFALEEDEQSFEFDVETVSLLEEGEETLEGKHVSDENPVFWTENTQNNSPRGIKTYTNVDGLEVQSPTKYDTKPVGASALCWDGTYSFSKSRRGTCSHHGGVRDWLR